MEVGTQVAKDTAPGPQLPQLLPAAAKASLGYCKACGLAQEEPPAAAAEVGAALRLQPVGDVPVGAVGEGQTCPTCHCLSSLVRGSSLRGAVL